MTADRGTAGRLTRSGAEEMKPFIAATLVVTSVLFAGCTSLQSGLATYTTVPDVERRIDSALPTGSTRQEIEAWLTGQGIEHSFSDLPYLKMTTATGSCLSDLENRSGGTIVGIIRNTDRSLFATGNIQLLFVLGKDGRLTERVVKSVRTGT